MAEAREGRPVRTNASHGIRGLTAATIAVVVMASGCVPGSGPTEAPKFPESSLLAGWNSTAANPASPVPGAPATGAGSSR